ncbi:MAG: hypothetical protein MUE54_07455 [Anaerolineae bacterium]|jgi:hypothetical protein|nr:hypothetical protein [Anaerolineae bacterium]
MKKLMVLSVMVMALLVMFIPATSAQEGGCYNLPQADCDYINAAAANTAAATSFYQKFSLNFEVSGLQGIAMLSPGLPSAISFQVAGEGAFVVDTADEFPANLNLPMSVTIDGTPAEVGFSVVDSVLYFSFNGQTFGVPILDFLNEMGAGDLLNTDTMNSNVDALGGMGSMFPVDSFINYTREGDVDWNGMSVSPFMLTFDLSGLLQSPEVGSLLGMAAPMLGGGAEADPTLTMLLQAIPQLMGALDLKLDVTQYVGTDNFIHKLTFNFNGTADLDTMIGALMGGAGGGQSMGLGVVTIAIAFDVELTQINEALTVTAPEGAVILSPEQVQDILGQLGGIPVMP